MNETIKYNKENHRIIPGIYLKVLIFISILLSSLFCVRDLRIYEMTSSSMEPTIHGRGSPPSRRGDWILVSLNIDAEMLHSNDIVLVDLPSSNVRTVLRVVNIPGDICITINPTDGSRIIPKDYYYLAADSSIGIDSHQLGLFYKSQIIGKVLRNYH